MDETYEIFDEDDPFAAKCSVGEEIANASTHGLGAVLSVAAMVVLVVNAARNGDALHIVGVTVFGASLVLLYFMSTVYHALQQPRLKRVFQIVDHSCIYLLIAGSYTPFTLGPLRGGIGWSLFGITWALALAGILIKILARGRFRRFSVLFYLGLGWIVVVAIKPVVESLPASALAWLIAGGAMYSLGVVFYLWRLLPYNHAIWHVFVLGGSVCHFVAVFWYAVQ